MPATRMLCGVVKSGSPMPSEITSFIVAEMSKKRRMPLGGTDATRCEMALRMVSILEQRSKMVDQQPLIAGLEVLQVDDGFVVEANAEDRPVRRAPHLFHARDECAESTPDDGARLLRIRVPRITLDVDRNHGASMALRR